MEFQMPNPREAHHGLRAMKSVALADGALSFAERAMMTSIQEIFGTAIEVDAVEPIEPDALAEAISDPQIRWQLVGGLVVMSLIDQDADGREAKMVDAFARALEVKSREVKNLRQLSKGHTRMARFDILRRFWAVDRIRERIREEGLQILWQSIRAARRKYDNPEMAARYRALGELAPGTLGRAYYEYAMKNEFPFPGEIGAAPETITYHDMAHVLGGYDTTPDEEILVASFSAGFRKKNPLTFIMFVLCQFHLGLPIGPGVPPSTGLFEPAKALQAIRRGAAMNVDLSSRWEYWDVIEEPVEVLRERYNIAPRD